MRVTPTAIAALIGLAAGIAHAQDGPERLRGGDHTVTVGVSDGRAQLEARGE
jgi:hypothetical protein